MSQVRVDDVVYFRIAGDKQTQPLRQGRVVRLLPNDRFEVAVPDAGLRAGITLAIPRQRAVCWMDENMIVRGVWMITDT